MRKGLGRMKIGVFGGTFNPVHRGHVRLAERFFAQLGLERLYIIPTKSPPHKPPNGLAEGADRLAMCRLAFEDKPGFTVSDLELRREGESYTLLTVKQLLKQHGDAQLYLITGGDMFLTFHTWYGFPALSQLVTVCAAARTPQEHSELLLRQKKFKAMGIASIVCDFEIIPVSSTQVRRTIAQGGDIGALVPEPVRDYITQRGLYR